MWYVKTNKIYEEFVKLNGKMLAAIWCCVVYWYQYEIDKQITITWNSQMMKIPRKKIYEIQSFPIQSRPNMTIYHIPLYPTKSIWATAVTRHTLLLHSIFSGWLWLIIIIKIKTMAQWANNWHLINDFIYSYDYLILQTRFPRMGSWVN